MIQRHWVAQQHQVRVGTVPFIQKTYRIRALRAVQRHLQSHFSTDGPCTGQLSVQMICTRIGQGCPIPPRDDPKSTGVSDFLVNLITEPGHLSCDVLFLSPDRQGIYRHLPVPTANPRVLKISYLNLEL